MFSFVVEFIPEVKYQLCSVVPNFQPKFAPDWPSLSIVQLVGFEKSSVQTTVPKALEVLDGFALALSTPAYIFFAAACFTSETL